MCLIPHNFIIPMVSVISSLSGLIRHSPHNISWYGRSESVEVALEIEFYFIKINRT